MARRLVVSDISEVQLALNQDHMRDLGVVDLVDEYRVLDLVDLSGSRSRIVRRRDLRRRTLELPLGP